MVPDKSDSRWLKIVEDPEAYKSKVSSLSTKMLLATLKIKGSREPAEQLVEHAHKFFVKNEKVVVKDIEALFN